MKHFTLRQLALQKKAWDSKNPVPFPGKWPTRIGWTFHSKRLGKNALREPEVTASYLGKPNAEQVMRFNRLFADSQDGNHLVEAVCWEFDRKNIFVENSYNSRADNPAVLQRGTLWDAYHPWQLATNWLRHFLEKNHLKNIGGFLAYSPTPKLKLEYIQQYKLWMMKNTGKQLKSAEERKLERQERLRARKEKAPVIEAPVVRPPLRDLDGWFVEEIE
jgi:hypothetical protein